MTAVRTATRHGQVPEASRSTRCDGAGRLRRGGRRIAALFAAAALVAASCGGSGGTSGAELPADEVEPAEAPSAPAPETGSPRPGEGIAAANGDVTALTGSGDCSPASAITIAYVGPDLARLDAIGLEGLVIEEPTIMIDAYAAAVNSAGGIRGRCIDTMAHLWDPADPVRSNERICAEVPASDPLFVINFLGDVGSIECLTVRSDIPTLVLHASVPAEMVVSAEGRLLLADGTHFFLLTNSFETALQSGHLDRDAKVGALRNAPSEEREYDAAMEATAMRTVFFDRYGLVRGLVPANSNAFGGYAALLPEEQAGLLRSDLTAAEQSAADAARAALAPDTAAVLDSIEDFYIKSATLYRDAGVEVMVSTAPWYELRRLMRAAELVDWHPSWIGSDIQGATLTLSGAPARQAERFVLVSARRAAGDEVPDLDRGCVALRNTASAGTFSHRHHTDAWSVITATCDLLDVAFSALTRTVEPISGQTFVSALRRTDYPVAYGGHITFGPNDSSGANLFRVLQADPECLLDDWGCMRALTEWLAPVTAAQDHQE